MECYKCSLRGNHPGRAEERREGQHSHDLSVISQQFTLHFLSVETVLYCTVLYCTVLYCTVVTVIGTGEVLLVLSVCLIFIKLRLDVTWY